MTTTQHTPGPWREVPSIASNEWSIRAGENQHIGRFTSAFSLGEMGIANARLIAAAPELLAALKVAESYLASRIPPASNGSDFHNALNAARAAIAKAGAA